MFLFIITPADLQMTSFSPTSTCFHSPARGPPQSSMSVGFYWPANQTSHYLLSTCSARKVWNHFRKTLQGNVQTTAPARGKLWQLAVESGTCKVILGMQVKRQHGKGKKIPLLYFRGLYPWGKSRQKHARNSTAFIPTKVKLSLILNTLQLKQKTDSSCSLMEPWKNRKSHVQIWQGHATYQRASPQEERGQSVRPPCSESCYCSVAPKVL